MRPIAAGIGSLGENLGAWLDYHLQHMVKDLPGLIKDIKHDIYILDGLEWKQDHRGLSGDVVNLYSLKPHELALHYLSQHMYKCCSYSPELREFLILSIHFLLTHKYFIFDKISSFNNAGCR